MKVLYVYDGHWPHNATRVGKQIDALRQARHEVTILSRGSAGRPAHESADGLTVVRMPFLRSAIANKLVNYPVFLNPIWVRGIRKNIRASRADCVVVRDLPLAPAALYAGAREGLPVHYDMAEVYPAALHSVLPHESGLVLKAVRASRAAEAIERWVVHRARTTFVVSDESRDRCVKLGVAADRVVLVGNTPANPEELRAEWPPPADIGDVATRPTALFVGNIFADRGLRYAIDAMALVIREVPEAMLVVVGDGRERRALEAQVTAHALGQHIRFVGWKHHDDHPAYLRYAQVGLLPFIDTPHLRITLANKVFDYMGAGLPVVASDLLPMRRVLEETKCGLVAPASDGAALAKVLVRLFRDADLRRQLGANGQAAIAGKYAWANDARRYVEAIERSVRSAS